MTSTKRIRPVIDGDAAPLNGARPHITIKPRQHFATMPAQVADIVQAATTYHDVQFTCNPERGLVQHRTQQSYCYIAENGDLITRAGLVPRIERELRAHSIDVDVVECTRWTQFERANPALAQARHWTWLQRGCLCALANEPRGRITYLHDSDVLHLLEPLVALYPQENILLVTKNNKTAERLAYELQLLDNRPVTWGSHYQRSNKAHIHVDSMASFVGRNVTHWTVVVAVGAETALADTTETLVLHEEALCFALVPAGRRLDSEESLRLEALYGPESYRVGDDATGDTHVTVLLLPPASYPPRKQRNPLERKRDNLWLNDPRNELIASTAHAVRTQDLPALRKLGVEIPSDHPLLNSPKPAPTVAIVVEAPQHGRALRKLLPEFRLIDATHEHPDTEKWPDVLFMPELAIVTHQRARLSDITADVIIRAEGIAQAWDPDYGPHAFISGSEMLVIDLLDDFDGRAKADGNRRQRDYTQRGWQTLGAGCWDEIPVQASGSSTSTQIEPDTGSAGTRQPAPSRSSKVNPITP